MFVCSVVGSRDMYEMCEDGISVIINTEITNTTHIPARRLYCLGVGETVSYCPALYYFIKVSLPINPCRSDCPMFVMVNKLWVISGQSVQ